MREVSVHYSFTKCLLEKQSGFYLTIISLYSDRTTIKDPIFLERLQVLSNFLMAALFRHLETILQLDSYTSSTTTQCNLTIQRQGRRKLMFGIIFLKIVFQTYKVSIFVQTFPWTSSEIFFNFRISRRKSKTKKNQQKRSKIL